MKQEKPKIKTTVFEHFTKLTNENENVRLAGAYSLIQQFEKNGEAKVNKIFLNLQKLVLKAIHSARSVGNQLCNQAPGSWQWILHVKFANWVLHRTRWISLCSNRQLAERRRNSRHNE
jgi:hypothetical protein